MMSSTPAYAFFWKKIEWSSMSDLALKYLLAYIKHGLSDISEVISKQNKKGEL